MNSSYSSFEQAKFRATVSEAKRRGLQFAQRMLSDEEHSSDDEKDAKKSQHKGSEGGSSKPWHG